MCSVHYELKLLVTVQKLIVSRNLPYLDLLAQISRYTRPLKNKKEAIDETRVVVLQGALVAFGSPEDAFPKALLIWKYC